LAKLEIRLKEEKDDIQKKFEDYKKEIENLEVLNIIILKSKLYSRMMDKVNRVTTEVIRPHGSTKAFNVVVMEKSQYDKAQQLINECQSWDQYENLKLAYIYNNGRRGVTSQNINIDITTGMGDSISISTESLIEHVVLCMTNIKISAQAQSHAMTNFFTSQLALNEQKAAEIKSQYSMIEQEQVDLAKTMRNNQDKLEKTEESRLTYSSKLLSEKQLLDSNNDICLNAVIKSFDKLEAMLKESLFMITLELSKLLLTYHIEVSIFADLPNIQRSINEILNTRNNVLVTMAKHSTELQGLITEN